MPYLNTMQTAKKKSDHCITYQNVLDAAEKIEGIVHRTPVLTSSSLNESYDDSKNNRRLFFKIEAMQRTGSFKFRGALNATLHLVDEIIASTTGCRSANEEQGKEEQHLLAPKVHVVTHSSGNHAAAVALAARLASDKTGMDIRATIVMPKNAPTIKVNGVLGFGGDIVFVESTNEAREEMADKIVEEKGAKFIHPSEDPKVIAAQGTTCLEFVDQVRTMIKADLDAVVIPVGGGGLAAGNTVALRGLLGDKVKIILAEPAEMDDAKRSKEAGVLLGHDPSNKLNSVADGLKTTLGKNTWPIVRDLVDDIITVSEKDILAATKLVWERLKISIEPSAGVGVAVALGEEFAQKYPSSDGYEKVGIILCGGNVDLIKVCKIMESHGL